MENTPSKLWYVMINPCSKLSGSLATHESKVIYEYLNSTRQSGGRKNPLPLSFRKYRDQWRPHLYPQVIRLTKILSFLEHKLLIDIHDMDLFEIGLGRVIRHLNIRELAQIHAVSNVLLTGHARVTSRTQRVNQHPKYSLIWSIIDKDLKM